MSGALWLLVVGDVLAHPFHNEFYGHDLTVDVGLSMVRVDYRADIPTKDLWSEVRALEREHKPTDGFADRKAGELMAGLALSIDGTRPAITALPADPPTVETKFTRMHVAFSAPLAPDAPHHLVLGNANAPEKLAYFRISTRVARRWLVTGSSLFAPDRAWDGQWRTEEAARGLALDVAPRAGAAAWVLAVHPDPDGARSATEALTTSTSDEFGQTWVPSLGFGAAVTGIVAYAALRARKAA